MGRDKLKRTINFKPKCKEFKAVSCDNKTITLLHEEMEALYLMDIKKLYQADCASAMDISRPTFARIIKNAREKLTMMLVTGSNLSIQDQKDEFKVIIPSKFEDKIKSCSPNAIYFHIYIINNKQIINKEIIKNPSIEQALRPVQIIPSFCMQNDINYFICNKIGEGLQSVLLSKGIYSIIIDGNITIDKINNQIYSY